MLTSADMNTVNEDKDYELFEKLIQDRIAANTQPLFTTDVSPDLLWSLYLNNLPRNRQYYNCNCCRRFIQQYGGLVTLTNGGQYSQPFLWTLEGVPEFFQTAVKSLWSIVKIANVTGIFLSKDEIFGTPISRVDKKDGDGNPYKIHTWTHLCGKQQKPFQHLLLTANQAMAEKLQEFQLLKRTLVELDSKTVKTAQQILQQGGLYRSEKAVAVAEWLNVTMDRLKVVYGKHYDQVLWDVVATAPTGFCHVKNTVLGTLLEDIENGLSFTVISECWKQKLHPLQYQRPTAAPTAGNVAAAEKIFKELNLEAALKRRYALLSEIPAEVVIWKPKEVATKVPKPGLFSDLLPEVTSRLVLPPSTMTWAKFSRDLLPFVSKMMLKVPAVGGFYGLVTAVDETAPPILQWDRPEKRNPFSHYFYNGGSSRESWNIGNFYTKEVTTAEVLTIMESPANWYTAKSNQGDKLFFVLKGCKDMRQPGLCLFPETLRSELREVRSTIEAYSKTRQIEQVSGQQACGICGFPITVEVTSSAGLQTVTIDRLE